jgi:hypothetical protein
MVQDPQAALSAVLSEILSIDKDDSGHFEEEAEAVLAPAGLGR